MRAEVISISSSHFDKCTFGGGLFFVRWIVWRLLFYWRCGWQRDWVKIKANSDSAIFLLFTFAEWLALSLMYNFVGKTFLSQLLIL